MANRTIFTTPFRVSFPHLAAPQEAQKAGETPKYGISMMFPKSGICPINNQPSSYANIVAALGECTTEAWALPYDQAIAPGMGIQFPPTFKDGDTVFQKDTNGHPIAGKIAPETAGMWILSAKNVDPVGTVDPQAVDCAPSAIYAGSWAIAQLECSAYDGKLGRVVVVKLINVQLAYNDEPFGNKPVAQSAAQAFAGNVIADTNVQAGAGQTTMAPVQQPPALPPGTPPPVAAPPVAAAPPALPTPPPVAAAPPGSVAAPPPPPVAAPPKTPVIMNAGEASYESMIQAGWTDELLVQHGKGVLNYL